MPAKTHHILIFDLEDTLVLAGAYLKQKKHGGAKILAPTDIVAGTPVFRDTDPTPWKLHIIEHGSKGKKKFGSKSLADVAQLIIDTGLPKQPDVTSDERTWPVVRLDVCQSALKDTATQSTLEQLSAQLSMKLAARKRDLQLKGDERVLLWGGTGNVIAPWDEKRGGRMIGDPKKGTALGKKWKEAKADFKTRRGLKVYGEVGGVKGDYLAWLLRGHLQRGLNPGQKSWLNGKADEIDTIWANPPGGKQLDAKAKIAWTLYHEAMQKFHTAVQIQKDLTLSKPPERIKLLESNPTVGKQSYLWRKSQYLVRAIAKAS